MEKGRDRMSSRKNEHQKRPNGSGKRLIAYQLNDNVRCFALSNETGMHSFVDEWLDNPRTEEKARNLLSAVLKISTNGLGWAAASRKVRRIAPDLYEIKNFFGASRAMAHIHVAETVVILRPFQGHSGTGNIQSTIIASATRQQRVVVELLELEEYDGH